MYELDFESATLSETWYGYRDLPQTPRLPLSLTQATIPILRLQPNTNTPITTCSTYPWAYIQQGE